MTALELEVIQKFKSLLDTRLKGYQVIAFGSRARGDADEDSDLDLLVITEEAETWELQHFVSGCAWEAGFDSGVVICPIVVCRKDWESSPRRSSLLALAIQREGVPV